MNDLKRALMRARIANAKQPRGMDTQTFYNKVATAIMFSEQLKAETKATMLLKLDDLIEERKAQHGEQSFPIKAVA